MSMNLTGEATRSEPELHPLDVLLPEFGSFMDMVRVDFTDRGLWTEYDQGLRDRIIAYNLAKLNGTLGAPTAPVAWRRVVYRTDGTPYWSYSESKVFDKDEPLYAPAAGVKTVDGGQAE